jgi:hypothetical protein
VTTGIVYAICQNCRIESAPWSPIQGLCIACAKAELTHLRGIKTAVMGATNDSRYAAQDWRELAIVCRNDDMPAWATTCDAIADAPEK